MWKLALAASARLSRAAVPPATFAVTGALIGVWSATALVPLLVWGGPSALSPVWFAGLAIPALFFGPWFERKFLAAAEARPLIVPLTLAAWSAWPLFPGIGIALQGVLARTPLLGRGLAEVVGLVIPVLAQAAAILLAGIAVSAVRREIAAGRDADSSVNPAALGFGLLAGVVGWTLVPVTGWGFWMPNVVCAVILAAAFRVRQVRVVAGGEALNAVESRGAVPAVLALTLLAFVLAAIWRQTIQLAPETIQVVIGGILGLAGGWWCGGRHRADTRSAATAVLASLGLLSVWGWAMDWRIDLSLWSTATIDRTWRLMLVRGAMASLPMFALAWPASRLIGLPGTGWKPVAAGGMLCGLVAGNLLMPELGVAPLAASGLAGLCATAAVLWFLPRAGVRESVVAPSVLRYRTGFAIRAVAVGLALLAPWGVMRSYQPEYTARTLFSTSVFEAARNFIERRGLAMLDEGRCVARVDGTRSSITVWRHGGYQVQVRDNGLPVGSRSLDEQAFPQFSSEVLHAVLPLAIHERPEHVLIVGLGAGQALESVLAAPILSATCVEPKPEVLAAYRAAGRPLETDDPLADERLKIWTMSASRAWETTSRFDAILVQPDHPTMATGVAWHTREFYRRAASRLSSDGVFSQRLLTVDLGPASLGGLVATAQAEFREVMLFEGGPGEMVLLGTNSPAGLVRAGLVTRLQADHIRRRLSAAGLDWSVVLNHAAWSHSQLTQFASDVRSSPCSVANPWLVFAVPEETWNWTDKLTALRETLVGKAGRIADWIGDDTDTPEIVRRLAEVKGQTDLMMKYGDEYWAYRQAVREQVTHKPRSLLKDRSGKSTGLHEEDRRRMQYFQALANAIKTRSLEDIERLEAFVRPYDPLLSFFVHAEAAEILSKVQPRQPERELRHRLHTIYYAPPRNRSVRAVVEAMRLVKDFPEAVPDAARRFDVRNSLLQALAARWGARGGVTPTSTSQTLGDIDSSLVLSEHLFALQAESAAEAGWSAEDWRARHKVLDRYLVAPLEGYRQRLLPRHHQKQLEYASRPGELTAPAPTKQGPEFVPTVPGLPLAN